MKIKETCKDSFCNNKFFTVFFPFNYLKPDPQIIFHIGFLRFRIIWSLERKRLFFRGY